MFFLSAENTPCMVIITRMLTYTSGCNNSKVGYYCITMKGNPPRWKPSLMKTSRIYIIISIIRMYVCMYAFGDTIYAGVTFS